jgi:hypothetical protein
MRDSFLLFIYIDDYDTYQVELSVLYENSCKKEKTDFNYISVRVIISLLNIPMMLYITMAKAIKINIQMSGTMKIHAEQRLFFLQSLSLFVALKIIQVRAIIK